MHEEWKSLKPRNYRNQLIMKFAANEAHKHHLDRSYIKKFYSRIQLAFQFKQLSGDDVNYDGNIIKSISGIRFNEETRLHIIRNTRRKFIITENIIIQKPDKMKQMIDQWVKMYALNVTHIQCKNLQH